MHTEMNTMKFQAHSYALYSFVSKPFKCKITQIAMNKEIVSFI